MNIFFLQFVNNNEPKKMLSSVCVCVCDTHTWWKGGGGERGRDVTLVFPLQTPSVSCLFRECQLHRDTHVTFVLGCLAVKAVRLNVSTATEFHSMVRNFILNIYKLYVYNFFTSLNHIPMFISIHEHTLLH